MAAPKPWTPDEEQQLRELHGQGLSLRECGRRLNITIHRVSRHAEKLGLNWDRSKTASATNARVADNKARRATLESQLLTEAQDILASIKAPHIVFHWDGDNNYAEHTLNKPTTADIRNLMQSVGIAIDRSLKLSVYDGTGGDGGAAVDAWLTHMTGGGPGPLTPVAYM